MQLAHVSVKICATCTYYDGIRRVPTGGGFMNYEGNDGRCYRLNKAEGARIGSGASCNSWEAWGPIKQK